MTVPPEACGAHEHFPNPFELATPPGCQGWEEMYPDHVVFAGSSAPSWRGASGSRTASTHPSRFFRSTWCPSKQASSPSTTRTRGCSSYLRRSAMSGDCSTGSHTSAPTRSPTRRRSARRAALFARRGGYYYAHWDALYARWVLKVEAEIHALETIDVPGLARVRGRVGRPRGRTRLELCDCCSPTTACSRACTGSGSTTSNSSTSATARISPSMSSADSSSRTSRADDCEDGHGHRRTRPEPDEELRRLARLALELGVAEAVARLPPARIDLRAALAGNDAGARWLADYGETKQPWFNFSSGNAAWYHHHRSWNDDPALPIATIGDYIGRLEAGDDISRPRDALIAERERITREYRSLVASESLALFDQSLALARTVFPFVENHNFYIDHWYFTVFWNKVREFGALLCRHGFLTDQEDIFYLRSDDVRSALDELRLDWSTAGAGAPRGPDHWPPIVERRKVIYEALGSCTSPPALGAVPDVDHRPRGGHALGHHPERVQEWLSSSTRCRRRDAARSSRLSGRRRGARARDSAPGSAVRAATGGDTRRAVHVHELDARVRHDRRGRARLGRDHEPRGDRRARVRPTGCRGHGHSDETHQDR